LLFLIFKRYEYYMDISIKVAFFTHFGSLMGHINTLKNL